jgi:hypothetical protein
MDNRPVTVPGDVPGLGRNQTYRVAHRRNDPNLGERGKTTKRSLAEDPSHPPLHRYATAAMRLGVIPQISKTDSHRLVAQSGIIGSGLPRESGTITRQVRQAQPVLQALVLFVDLLGAACRYSSGQ